MPTEQDIFDFAVSQNKNLKSKPFRDVVDFAYSQNPKLRDAIISPQILPKQEPNIAAGKATAIRGLTTTEKAAGYMPAVGAGVGGLIGMISPVPGGTALGAGLGAGAGKAAEMFLRGGAPTVGERALEISKEATTAALGEAAFPLGIKGAATAFKAVKDPLKRMGAGLASAARGSKSSYESIARFLQGGGVGEALKEGKEVVKGLRVADHMTRLSTAVEKNATESFNKVQNNIEGYRSQLGKAVERVDNVLVNKMKGVYIDMTRKGFDYRQKIQNIVSDARLGEYIKGSDFTKFQNFINQFENAPYVDMESLIKFRKVLDENINWTSKMVGEKRPDAVERLMKEFRADIRSVISREASKKKLGIYDKIYSKFAKFADNWDTTLKQVYGSADESGLATSKSLDKFVNYFNKSGYKSDVLEGTAKYLPPQSRKEIEKLLDNAAAYNLLTEIGAPSSPVAGIMREMIINPTTLKMLKAGDPIDKVLQSHLLSKGSRVAGAMLGTEIKQ